MDLNHNLGNGIHGATTASTQTRRSRVFATGFLFFPLLTLHQGSLLNGIRQEVNHGSFFFRLHPPFHSIPSPISPIKYATGRLGGSGEKDESLAKCHEKRRKKKPRWVSYFAWYTQWGGGDVRGEGEGLDWDNAHSLGLVLRCPMIPCSGRPPVTTCAVVPLTSSNPSSIFPVMISVHFENREAGSSRSRYTRSPCLGKSGEMVNSSCTPQRCGVPLSDSMASNRNLGLS